MAPIHVREIIKVYLAESGCTCPLLVILEDGRKAVFKYPQNPQGSIVLFNEFFSCSIIKRIGITTPDYGIGYIDERTTIGIDDDASDDTRRYYGMGFFSVYIPNAAVISPRAAKHAANLDEISTIVLADEIIKNADRHKANVLIDISGSSPIMHMIDHSHAFGDPDWDKTSLLVGDASSPYVWRENSDLYEMLVRAGGALTGVTLTSSCDRIKAMLTPEYIDTTLMGLPSSWDQYIGKEKCSLAREYVLYRVNNLDKICEMIKKERGM